MTDDRWDTVDRAWSRFFWTGTAIIVVCCLAPLFVLVSWWVFG